MPYTREERKKQGISNRLLAVILTIFFAIRITLFLNFMPPPLPLSYIVNNEFAPAILKSDGVNSGSFSIIDTSFEIYRQNFMPLSDKKRRGLIFDAADCSRLRRSRERRSG